MNKVHDFLFAPGAITETKGKSNFKVCKQVISIQRRAIAHAKETGI